MVGKPRKETAVRTEAMSAVTPRVRPIPHDQPESGRVRRRQTVPEQPAVHITIGRIEIRAEPSVATPEVLAPLPDRGPVREEKRLSLGEYLHGDDRRAR